MKEVESLLSNRMLMVAGIIKPCDVIFDIGTDHCYLPIYLIQKKICNKAVATDIRKGPIKIAKKNICIFEMEENIEAFVSEGINHVDTDADIVISGMGADVIISILNNDLNIAKSASQIVIQCQSRTERLRAFFWDNGFEITDEVLTAEKNKVYNAFNARYIGKIQKYTKIDTIASKLLVKNQNPMLSDYIASYIQKLDDMISGLDMGKKDYQNELELKRQLEALHESI